MAPPCTALRRMIAEQARTAVPADEPSSGHDRSRGRALSPDAAAGGGVRGPTRQCGRRGAEARTPGALHTAAGRPPVATHRPAVSRFASASMYGASALVGLASSPAIAAELRPASKAGEKSAPSVAYAPPRSTTGTMCLGSKDPTA